MEYICDNNRSQIDSAGRVGLDVKPDGLLALGPQTGLGEARSCDGTRSLGHKVLGARCAR